MVHAPLVRLRRFKARHRGIAAWARSIVGLSMGICVGIAAGIIFARWLLLGAFQVFS